MGIVNLEAMACETAVVATATGGIPEVVEHGVTGTLVPIDQASDVSGTPLKPEQFEADLGAAVNELLGSPERARAFGRAGRERAVTRFSWTSVARDTLDLYHSLAPSRPA
jgi:alpha-maltose-1-phosphate synthase